jgi:ankyrin repeat protein
VVKLLLSSGVDIESRDHNGKTALCAAVLNNKLDVVRFLCESDARVNIQGEKGWTPLTTAASDSGTIDSVKTLVKYGKDIDLEMKNGHNDTALLTASRNDKPDVVRFLCESGAKVNIQGEKGWTPLTAAASRGTIDSVKALVKYGKGIDLEMKNGSNNTALFVAVINEKPDVVRFLCESGANVNIYGYINNAWTPLAYAADNGLTEIVKILVQYGKDIDLGMETHLYSSPTPLKLASEKHYDDIVKILKENGNGSQQKSSVAVSRREKETVIREQERAEMAARLLAQRLINEGANGQQTSSPQPNSNWQGITDALVEPERRRREVYEDEKIRQRARLGIGL